MRIGKKELARMLAKKSNRVLICEAEEWVNTIFESIENALQYGDDVKIRGFGTFRRRHRNERNGYNPSNGEPLSVEAYNTVTFLPSKELRRKMNE